MAAAFRSAVSLALCALISACAASPDPDSLSFDPFEPQNRAVHEANITVDRGVYRPVSRAYGEGLPVPVRRGVTNLKHNWQSPRYFVQYTLQGRPVLLGESFVRFGVNTLFGFGGLLDIAGEMGIEHRETGFDETFHVWGVPEGGYVVLPFGGPGTQRDWTAWGLDILTDPVSLAVPPAAGWTYFGVATLDLVNDRYELDPTIDELYYNSEDSYTAVRISYLQNKRANLGGGTDLDLLEDVYADY